MNKKIAFNEKRSQLTFYINTEFKTRLKHLAIEENVSLSSLVGNWVVDTYQEKLQNNDVKGALK